MATESNDFTAFEEAFAQPRGAVHRDRPAEWWAGHDQISEVTQAQLKEMQGMRISPGEIEGYVEGDVGWFADQPQWVMQAGSEIGLRFTGVFRREGYAWRLVLGHSSIGVPSEEVVGFEMTT
jgi:hypothetical protein